MVKLKPCPFCGSDKLKIDARANRMYIIGMSCVEPYTFTVRCNKCHARGAPVTVYLRNAFYALSGKGAEVLVTKETAVEMAIEAWNRRADNGAQRC